MSAEGHNRRHPYAGRKRAWQQRLNAKLGLDQKPLLRKIVYSVLGVTVVLIGIVMIVTPGPAIVVVPLGLAILAGEFAWARRLVRRGKVFVGRRLQRRKATPEAP